MKNDDEIHFSGFKANNFVLDLLWSAESSDYLPCRTLDIIQINGDGGIDKCLFTTKDGLVKNKSKRNRNFHHIQSMIKCKLDQCSKEYHGYYYTERPLPPNLVARWEKIRSYQHLEYLFDIINNPTTIVMHPHPESTHVNIQPLEITMERRAPLYLPNKFKYKLLTSSLSVGKVQQAGNAAITPLPRHQYYGQHHGSLPPLDGKEVIEFLPEHPVVSKNQLLNSGGRNYLLALLPQLEHRLGASVNNGGGGGPDGIQIMKMTMILHVTVLDQLSSAIAAQLLAGSSGGSSSAGSANPEACYQFAYHHVTDIVIQDSQEHAYHHHGSSSLHPMLRSSSYHHQGGGGSNSSEAGGGSMGMTTITSNVLHQVGLPAPMIASMLGGRGGGGGSGSANNLAQTMVSRLVKRGITCEGLFCHYHQGGHAGGGGGHAGGGDSSHDPLDTARGAKEGGGGGGGGGGGDGTGEDEESILDEAQRAIHRHRPLSLADAQKQEEAKKAKLAKKRSRRNSLLRGSMDRTNSSRGSGGSPSPNSRLGTAASGGSGGVEGGGEVAITTRKKYVNYDFKPDQLFDDGKIHTDNGHNDSHGQQQQHGVHGDSNTILTLPASVAGYMENYHPQAHRSSSSAPSSPSPAAPAAAAAPGDGLTDTRASMQLMRASISQDGSNSSPIATTAAAAMAAANSAANGGDGMSKVSSPSSTYLDQKRSNHNNKSNNSRKPPLSLPSSKSLSSLITSKLILSQLPQKTCALLYRHLVTVKEEIALLEAIDREHSVKATSGSDGADHGTLEKMETSFEMRSAMQEIWPISLVKWWFATGQFYMKYNGSNGPGTGPGAAGQGGNSSSGSVGGHSIQSNQSTMTTSQLSLPGIIGNLPDVLRPAALESSMMIHQSMPILQDLHHRRLKRYELPSSVPVILSPSAAGGNGAADSSVSGGNVLAAVEAEMKKRHAHDIAYHLKHDELGSQADSVSSMGGGSGGGANSKEKQQLLIQAYQEQKGAALNDVNQVKWFSLHHSSVTVCENCYLVYRKLDAYRRERQERVQAMMLEEKLAASGGGNGSSKGGGKGAVLSAAEQRERDRSIERRIFAQRKLASKLSQHKQYMGQAEAMEQRNSKKKGAAVTVGPEKQLPPLPWRLQAPQERQKYVQQLDEQHSTAKHILAKKNHMVMMHHHSMQGGGQQGQGQQQNIEEWDAMMQQMKDKYNSLTQGSSIASNSTAVNNSSFAASLAQQEANKLKIDVEKYTGDNLLHPWQRDLKKLKESLGPIGGGGQAVAESSSKAAAAGGMNSKPKLVSRVSFHLKDGERKGGDGDDSVGGGESPFRQLQDDDDDDDDNNDDDSEDRKINQQYSNNSGASSAATYSYRSYATTATDNDRTETAASATSTTSATSGSSAMLMNQSGNNLLLRPMTRQISTSESMQYRPSTTANSSSGMMSPMKGGRGTGTATASSSASAMSSWQDTGINSHQNGNSGDDEYDEDDDEGLVVGGGLGWNPFVLET